jgi:C4-dicarboxylate transporter
MAAVAAGLMIGPLEVGVAVTTAAGVMLLFMPTLLPTAGCIGVLESPAAETRPVFGGWASSESLAVAASARNINPCI